MKEFFKSEKDRRGCGKLVYGVGINDVNNKTINGGVRDPVYMKWKGLLCRVYSKIATDRRKNYADTLVCDEWLRFSNFKTWFESQIGHELGYEIDKDLLVKGSNLYSPDTCTLVPSEINKFLINATKKKEGLPLGVHQHVSGKYKAQINENGKRVCLITTDSVEKAYRVYCSKKKEQAKKLADKYKGKVDDRVYVALINYEV